MLKLLKIVLDTGNVTTAYPFGPVPFTTAFRGKPEHRPAQCVACAACAVACPANALTFEVDMEKGLCTWQLFVGRCIFCGRCEEVCPARAIQLTRNFELAVFRKEDLYERATFRLCHCRQCRQAFAPQKEVDYVLALTLDARGESEENSLLRQQFETCPSCKRKAALVVSQLRREVLP